MRMIGVIGGLSWESSALYYRLLNERVRERLGGLHSARLLLWSFDFAAIEALQAAGDWPACEARMAEAADALVGAGAEILLVASNTMHRTLGSLSATATARLVHIADPTAAAIRAAGSVRPGLLATAYTMEQDFYLGRLRERHGIDAIVPDDADRRVVHRIIYDELCLGVVRPESRRAYLDVIARLRDRGADGIILGCTEIGMLISADDVDLPVFDTTLLHARRAADLSIDGPS